jgi:serine/alanine adding enzyme
MDVKYFIQAPTQALAELGLLTTDSKARDLLGMADQLATCKEQLKAAKKDKAEIARQFKAVQAGSSEHSRLIASMQSVSDAIKNIEVEFKSVEKALTLLLDADHQQSTDSHPPFVVIPREQEFSGSYTIRELQKHEWDQWYQFISRQVTSAYHQKPWPEVIEQSFGHPTRLWVAVSAQGEILGGVPLTFFSSKLFGRFAVSIPYFNYGGVISKGFNVARDLISHLQSVCVDESLSHIEVRCMQSDLGAQVSSKKVSMVLALPTSDALLDDQLGAKVRAQYKKAEIHEPVIRFGKLELLDDFYKVFARNMRDLGTPVYAKSWFARILAQPAISSQLAVVYVKQQPVSSGFLIGYGTMLEIPWASTIKAANAMNTNMWMYRQILGYAIRQGYRFFDFGRSTRDAGTYKFKKQWGAQPYTHYWYYLFPEGGTVPELNPDNPKYKLMIAIWKLMPIWLTKLIGPPVG